MTICTAPTYNSWRAWLFDIPQIFTTQGKVIYDARNQIRLLFAPNGEKVCVKRFHQPHFLNRYIYRYLRDSKAKRSFDNGLYLLAHGIGTPEPIGYIEEYSWGGLNYSYLITRLSQLTRLNRDFTLAYTPDLEDSIRPLARYTANMHNEGILHLDFSPGNILWDIVDNEYRFEVVDVNRMVFGHVSMKAGCRNIQRLCARSSFFDTFADEYARTRHMSPNQCRYWIHYYRNRFWHFGKKANYQYD